MNQLNQLLESYQSNGKKLRMLRLEQSVFQTAVPAAVTTVMKENQFEAICLIATLDLEDCLSLCKTLACRLEMPVVLEVAFHKVLRYGISRFAEMAGSAGVSGIRVPDLPFEEQGQLAVHLLDEEGPFLIREVTPASGDRIIQNMQFARGFIWCSNQGNVEFLSSLAGDPLTFYLYAVEAAATRPFLLDFNSKSYGEAEKYLDAAAGMIVGEDLADEIRENGYSADLLRQYCSRFCDPR